MAAADMSTPKIQPYKTNLNVCVMGLIIFLVSELALFGEFFMYYANLRLARGVEWPGDFHIPADATSINTLILVVSSFTCEFALLSLDKKGKGGRVFAWLFVTFVLGSIFLGLQVYEYMTIGFTPQDTSVGAIFFSLTGLHGLHVFVGLLLLGLGMIRAVRGRWSPDNHVGLLGISVYWHFVDIVWVILFAVVYCLPSS